MFVARVSGLDAGMKNKVNDFTADQAFDGSKIARRTDSAWTKDHDNYGSNVAHEAGAAF